MLRLLLKNKLLGLFGLIVAIAVAGCGAEESASLPSVDSTNCASSYATSTTEVLTSPSGSFTYGTGPVKVTISKGTPPFIVNTSNVLALSATEAVPGTFDATTSTLLLTAPVPFATDPSCSTFVFWFDVVGGLTTGSYSDIVNVHDSNGLPAAALNVSITIP